MKKITTKPISLLSLAILLTLLLSLTACTSSQNIDAPSDTVVSTEEATNGDPEDQENIAITTVEDSSKESESETIIEELYIPEGVDINSTLPGQEWLDSFIGNVNEPVVVVYNDTTERKEVIQAGSEVEINPDEDLIAIYWPEVTMGETTGAISVKETLVYDYYHILIMNSEKMRDIPVRPVEVIVMGGEKDWILEFTILVQ